MKSAKTYTLLTFYAFVDIQDPHAEVAEHKQFCEDIGMKWRIYIGEEWISATVTWNIWQIQAYKLYLAASKYFKDIPDIDTKATMVDGHCFEKMIVKYRKEIVALWEVVNQKMIEQSHKEIRIDEFKNILDKAPESITVLDMRNDFEYQLGHFKHAIPAGTINFREVKSLIKKYKEKLGDKKVVMYCTGWIRCEKLSALLAKEGMQNVYALDGGVVKYVNTHNDGNRLGNLYTFDGRVSAPVGDKKTHVTIGKCIYTDQPTDNYENCRYSPCNARIICDQKEYRKHMWFCSEECMMSAQETLLIKDVPRDRNNYKLLRWEIKQDPTKKEEIHAWVAAHLKRKLLHTIFRHKTSQKESIVMER